MAETAQALGLMRSAAAVRPIRSEEWPAPAPRPAYSVLDCSDTWKALAVEPIHWRHALASCLGELASG